MADEVQQHILGAVVATAADQLQNSHPRPLPRLKSMAHSENRSTCGTGGAAQSNWKRGLTHVNCFSPGSFTWIRKRGIASRGHSGLSVARRLKSLGHSVAFRCGLSTAAAKSLRCGRIIMYHGIQGRDAPSLTTQLRYLRRHFPIVPLGQIV